MENGNKIQNTTFSNTYEKLVFDVCRAFQDVTGAEADPKRDAAPIMHWKREQGWDTFDFRLIMEFCTTDAKEKEFFSHPGRMNIRAMFNPARGSVLVDIHSDLKRAKEIQLKQQQLKSEGLKRPMKLLMKCGAKISREDYDKHSAECFAAKGKCFFP